ncbi:MAG: hypothetical protein KC416_07205, partial [Myxococcales bacterium]|nr:hypothetical protein [Myxococcales bacterium]
SHTLGVLRYGLTALGLWTVLGIGGCIEIEVPRPGIDGGSPPTMGPVDTDGDGLCDDSEWFYSSDPLEPDTDGDGFTDYLEVALGFSPISGDSPSRDLLVEMPSVPGAEVVASVRVVVEGQGEDYTGFVVDEPSPLAAQGRKASEYVSMAVATVAVPVDNVGKIVPEVQQFQGVVGATELQAEVTFAQGDEPTDECLVVLPFRYAMKRNDGTVVDADSKILLLVPEGFSRSEAPACAGPTVCF